MEQSELISKLLACGAQRLTTETRFGTFMTTNRSSLVAQQVNNRSSADWKKAQYIIINKDKDNSARLATCLFGWKSMAEEGQFLVIYENEEWLCFDYLGNQVSLEDMLAYKPFSNNVGLSLYSKSSRQMIFYGAPGTGKSYEVKKNAKNENSIRTTFHPDSDYSTFVGAYKPTMGKKPLYGLFGDKTIRYKDGDDLSEDTISYKFIPQAFLKAYVEAWRRWSEGNEEPYYLVIEEINRGNCAQIFGDLFQLLDRDTQTGYSTYAIEADDDIRRFISEDENGNLIEKEGAVINDVKDKDGDTIATGEDIVKGKKLVLPPNLYIWATMNTSDQSLFPIDSAFKRRWDWEYVPIEYKNESWYIEIGEEKYSWVSFQKEINKRIFDETDSEDKKLGDYFVVAKGDKITEETFKNKVLFYLWNDVFKDGESDVFKINDKERFSFSVFFDKESGRQNLLDFMEKLGVEKL